MRPRACPSARVAAGRSWSAFVRGQAAAGGTQALPRVTTPPAAYGQGRARPGTDRAYACSVAPPLPPKTGRARAHEGGSSSAVEHDDLREAAAQDDHAGLDFSSGKQVEPPLATPASAISAAPPPKIPELAKKPTGAAYPADQLNEPVAASQASAEESIFLQRQDSAPTLTAAGRTDAGNSEGPDVSLDHGADDPARGDFEYAAPVTRLRRPWPRLPPNPIRRREVPSASIFSSSRKRRKLPLPSQRRFPCPRRKRSRSSRRR